MTHPEDPSSVPASVQTLLKRADSYVLPVYARPPFFLSHGKGAYVWDTEGRKYLDFSAGIAVNALGHADEGVAQVSLNDLLVPITPNYHSHGAWRPRTCSSGIRTRCFVKPFPP